MSAQQPLPPERVNFTAFLQGDVREVLKTIPDESIQCCVTSPPYFGLRDYNVAGQIGLEPTPDEYVAEMVAVFREVRRALRPDGSLWLNLGDSYARAGTTNVPQTKNPRVDFPEHAKAGSSDGAVGRGDRPGSRSVGAGIKSKDLLLIPYQVASALRADGWYLRSSTIWHKPNAMPESVRDRPACCHENIFLLTKKERYFYDAVAAEEPAIKGSAGSSFASGKTGIHQQGRASEAPRRDSATRNRRNVWSIPTRPYKAAHFATFPIDIPLTCIQASTSEWGGCGVCKAPFKRVLSERVATGEKGAGNGFKREPRLSYADDQGVPRGESTPWVPTTITTTGWSPTCGCNSALPPVPCLVLDPFAGSGTTMLASQHLGRDSVGVELNPEYIEIARQRVGGSPLDMFIWSLL